MKSRRRLASVLCALVLLVPWVGTAAVTPAGEPLSWKQAPGEVSLLQGTAMVWRFDYGTNATKPLFHPVALPGGPCLTWDRPEDHRWHRALWFSWKFINGLNYWEEDPATGLAAGRARWQPPAITLNKDFSARIALQLDYAPPGQAAVLTEQRVIEITSPAADGTWWMDWDLKFTAGLQDVCLDRTPLPEEPEGKPWGGYAGLSVRFSRELQDAVVSTTTGPVSFKENRYRGKSPAMDYSGRFGDRTAGIAVFDDAANLNSPSPWYAIQEPAMKYFSPAVLCYGPHTLKAGSTLQLRYRVAIHPDRWDAATLRAQAQSQKAR